VTSAAAVSFTRVTDRDRRVTAQGKWDVTYFVLTDGQTSETLAERMAIESDMYFAFTHTLDCLP
jgi:hypothetical protein